MPLGANESRIGVLYAAGSVGVVVLALLAAPSRKRWSFGQVTLGALLISGVLTIMLAFTTSFWLAALILALMNGFSIIFNISTGSLRQTIVPNELLGRIVSVATVTATCASPLGSLLGGVAIQQVDNVALVYEVIGALAAMIALAFAFTSLGHAQRYLPSVELIVESAT